MKLLGILFLIVASAVALPFEREDDNFLFEGLEKRIVGGSIAKPGQFPYQARIVLNKLRNGRLEGTTCGGSLISDRVVLTAAHCLYQAVSAIVFLGSSTLRPTEPTSIAVRVGKSGIIIHENWSYTSYSNDIGLLIFPTPVQFNNGVKPVDLPKASEGDLTGRTAIISGFGYTRDGSGLSHELRYLSKKIREWSYCKNAFPEIIKPSHLCIDGLYGKSPCLGDSGGPLVVEDANGSRTIVGLTSFGDKSCQMGYPVIYTRIASFLQWINQKTRIPIRK